MTFAAFPPLQRLQLPLLLLVVVFMGTPAAVPFGSVHHSLGSGVIISPSKPVANPKSAPIIFPSYDTPAPSTTSRRPETDIFTVATVTTTTSYVVDPPCLPNLCGKPDGAGGCKVDIFCTGGARTASRNY